MAQTTSVSVGDLAALLPSWRRSLAAENKSPRTVQSYLEAAEQLVAFLRAAGMPTEATSIRREHVEAFIEHILTRPTTRHPNGSPSTAANRHRSLQQLFRWLEEEGEIERSPMAKMRLPKVPDQPVEVFTEDEQRALLAMCKGNGFEDRRDTAIMRLFLSVGPRVGGVAGLKLDDVDLDRREVRITVKGGNTATIPLSPKTVKALDRYLRVRPSHRDADEPWLWLGRRGRMRESGVYQMIRRRGEGAGVEHAHPHRFRHTFAHEFRMNGGSEDDLMRLGVWRSRDMLGRYGASAADERAREAHSRFAPGESI